MQFRKNLASSAVIVALLGGCDDSNNDNSSVIEQQITTYELTTTVTPADSGSLAANIEKDDYEEGSNVVITATAENGYVFDHWEGDISGATIDNNAITLIMSADKSLTAIFIEEPASIDPNKIVINELRSTGGGYDYIELFNSGTTDFTFSAGDWAVNDLKGFTVDNEPGIAIPGGTVIPANGFLLIATDQTAVPFDAPVNTLVAGQGDTDFGLGKGDTALLIYQGTILEQATYNDGSHVETWGRLPDGGAWHDQLTALAATPGAANTLPDPVVEATADDIVINEVVSKGRDDIDFDYVELYNQSSEPYVFAEGEWELLDLNRETNGEAGLSIPGGTEIAGNGFLVLLPGELEGAVIPNLPANSVLNAGEDFGLGKGETIKLKYKGEEHETVSYGDFHVNAYGRLPDGGEFISLPNSKAVQLYASPGLKNFLTPVDELSVNTLDFSKFNADEATLETAGFRVFGKDADLASDVEPEYIAVSADSSTAWVALQENNGLARIDLTTDNIEAVMPLGFKDYGAAGNEIDASDKDDTINLTTYPDVKGMYQPDGIATFERNGTHYVITANEGDVRDWFTNFEEDIRVEDALLDNAVFPDAATLQQADQLGRLAMTKNLTTEFDTPVFDTVYSFGGRSFSIWNGMTGEQVYDSGSDLARQAIAANVFPDKRSDAKGVEPESVTTGMVGAKHLAFIALERADTVAVYDITDLNNISFEQMLATQDDDAPEGVLFIPADESPGNQPLVVVANEDSGNITVYQANAEGRFEFASRLLIEGGEGSAEISAFDPATNKLFLVNNGELNTYPRIEVLNLADPGNVQRLGAIDVSYYGGGINSVTVANGKLAAAIEGVNKQHRGFVVIFDTQTEQLTGISPVGALPDMVTFTPDGKTVLTADEGEPSEDYAVDPAGTVSVIRFVENN